MSTPTNLHALKARVKGLLEMDPQEMPGLYERFNGTLKMELLYELPLQTRSATRSAVADYIETLYNVRRRHSSLDYRSPVEFELKNGEHGGSVPVPPVMNEKGRGQESPSPAA